MTTGRAIIASGGLWVPRAAEKQSGGDGHKLRLPRSAQVVLKGDKKGRVEARAEGGEFGHSSIG